MLYDADQGTLLLVGGSKIFSTWGFLPTINNQGDKVAPRHVIEGLLLCSQHKAGPFQMASGVIPKLSMYTLRLTAIQEICRKLENDVLFEPEACYQTVGEAAYFYETLGKQRTADAGYLLDGNAVVAFSRISLPTSLDNTFCNSLVYSGREAEAQLVETGSAILLFGPRATDRARWSADQQFRMTTDFYRHGVEEMFAHAKHAAAQGALFYHGFAAIGPPHLLRPLPVAGDAVIGEITQRMLYWKARNETARLDVLCASFDATSFKWECLHEVAVTFGRNNRAFVALRSLLKSISPKIEVDDPVDMLNEGEILMQGRRAHTADQIVRKGLSGAELTQALVRDTEVGAVRGGMGVSADPPSDEDGDRAGSAVAIKHSRLSLTKNALNAVLRDPSFLLRRSESEDVLQRGETLAEKELYQLMSALISNQGSLIFCQLLFRHAHIKDAHEFLQLVYRLQSSLSVYYSYGMVTTAKHKREGLSATYVFSTKVTKLWDAGNHVEISWYRDVRLEIEKSITGASKVAAGDELDFLLHDDKFDAVGKVYHRYSILKGLAAAPSSGYSVLQCWDLLRRMRKHAQRCSLARQPRMWQSIADFYADMQREGGAYVLYQMDTGTPAGLRMQGYLPATSGTGGFVKRIKAALKGYKKFAILREEVPGAFDADDFVAGSAHFVGWSQVHGTGPKVKTEAKPKIDGGGADRGSGGEIGSRRKGVQWLKHANHLDYDFFCLGKGSTRQVYGPLRELAKALGIEYSTRCWVVGMSRKPDNERCTMCSWPGTVGHTSRCKKMHARVQVSADLLTKYRMKYEKYVAKYPRQPAAETSPLLQASSQ